MSRRAFTIVPIPALLAVVVIALGLVLAFKGSGKPPTGNAAYDQGKSIGAIVGPIVIALFFVWLASRIAERKSETLATLIISPILLLMGVAYGMNVMGWAKPLPKQKKGEAVARLLGVHPDQASPGAGSGATAASPTSPAPAGPRPRPTPSGTAEPVSSTPPPPPPPPPPIVPARARPATPAFDTAAVYAAEGDAKAEAVLATIAADLGKQVADLEMKAALAVDELLKTPAHDKRVLKARREQAAELQSAAELVSRSLDDAREAAGRALEAAGLDVHQSTSMSMTFANTTEVHRRSLGADELARFAATAIEEIDALDAEFPRWKLNAQREIDSTDFALRGRLRGLRMFTTSFERRKDDALAHLRGE